MEVGPKDPQFYVSWDGKAHAQIWIDGLQDLLAEAAIIARLAKIRRGLLGDCERYGAVTELRIHHGPGYRLYVVEDGKVLVVLLCGGEKSGQKEDFKRARRLADDYQKEKRAGTAKLRPVFNEAVTK